MSREVAPQEEVLTPTPATPETDTQGQSRDEHGKFAPKQETAGTTTDPDNAAQGAVEGGAGKGQVPIQAVHAARDKARQAEDEAAALRREVAELRGAISTLNRPTPAQPAEPKPKASIWTDPDAFLAERLAPVQQEAQQRHMLTSRMLASDKYGADTVKEADNALGAIMQQNPNDPDVIALQQRVMAAEHPYAELVTWHQRRKAMADIGDDPTTYEARLREKIMAELATTSPAPTTTQQQPAAKTPMPSNFASARSEGPRTGVVFEGPKPLSEITKGSAQ